MSRKSAARSNARGSAKAAGGAHLTRQARMSTLDRVIRTLYSAGHQVAGIDGLKERHVALYFERRKADGIGTRTMQNEVAHIRAAMRAAGRSQAAASPSISNRALGLDGSSRDGTKTAATPEQYQGALDLARTIDVGIHAVLGLERTLGLRAAEAIRSGPSLATWERQLEAGERVLVIYGTKGGRDRLSSPADREAALEAVRTARSVAADRGGRLIDKPTLKQAMTYYRNVMNRRITEATGMCGHALRYAYAVDRVAAYGAEGLSTPESLAKTSIDLGHGDGRGTYVSQVYAKDHEWP